MWSHAVSCIWLLKNLGVLVPVSMCFYSDYSLERKRGRPALPQLPCECSAESVPQTPTCSPQHQTWCCCSRNGEVVDFWGQFICYRSTDWRYRKIKTILLVRWKPGWVISVLWASCPTQCSWEAGSCKLCSAPPETCPWAFVCPFCCRLPPWSWASALRAAAGTRGFVLLHHPCPSSGNAAARGWLGASPEVYLRDIPVLWFGKSPVQAEPKMGCVILKITKIKIPWFEKEFAGLELNLATGRQCDTYLMN